MRRQSAPSSTPTLILTAPIAVLRPTSPRITTSLALIACLSLLLSLFGCGEKGIDETLYGNMPVDNMHAPDPDPGIPDSLIGHTVSGQIKVLQQVRPEREASSEPTPGISVELQWVEQGHQGLTVIERYKAVSGKDGIARYDAIRVPKSQGKYSLRALVSESEMNRFFPMPHPEKELKREVRLMRLTGNVDELLGQVLVTVVSMPQEMQTHASTYGFVQIRQIFQVSVRGWQIYNTASALNPDHTRGLKIELPFDAKNAQGFVTAEVNGRRSDGSGYGAVEVSDGVAHFQGLLYPDAKEMPKISFGVMYFIKPKGSKMKFDQPMSMGWGDVRFTVLSETDLPDHPILPITLEMDLPQHALGGLEYDDKAASGIMMGRKVQIARNFSLEKGERLVAHIDGFPYRESQTAWYVIAAAVMMGLGGLVLGRYELKLALARRELIRLRDDSILEEFDVQIKSIYQGLYALEEDLRGNIVSEKMHAEESERLRMRLLLLKQRREHFLADAPQATTEAEVA